MSGTSIDIDYVYGSKVPVTGLFSSKEIYPIPPCRHIRAQNSRLQL